jgi:hypothetical protein
VCTEIGACEVEQFEFVSEPLDYTQDQWDDKCYVCQAFAKDLEERVQLVRHVTEGNIVPIVASTCERLVRCYSLFFNYFFFRFLFLFFLLFTSFLFFLHACAR